MRRQSVELVVGLGLLLGPLAYALTLEPEVVEVAHVVRVEREPTVIVQEPPEPETTEPETTEPEAVPEPTPTPTPEGRLAFAFVNEAGLVLSTEAKPQWGKGRLREHAGPGTYRAAKRANARTVPEALWAHRGRTFDLYDADGKVCTARLGELSVVAQHDGPSLYDLFHGDEDDADYYVDYETFEAKKHSPKQIRTEVWSKVSADTMWLAAELVSETSCEGALWARDHALPQPTVLHPSTDVSDVSLRRVAQHKTSEELAEMKAGYTEWYDELTEREQEYYNSWEAITAREPLTTRTWLDSEGVAQLIELDFGEEDEGCGDGYSTIITALDRVTDEGFDPTGRSAHPLAVFDADLDGELELLYNDGYVHWAKQLSSDTLETSWSLDEVWYCPC